MHFGSLFADGHKFDTWLQVELAVCEAWADEGVIPRSDMEKLRSATYDMDRLEEALKCTRHDMTAFLESVTEGLGPEGRWLHLGLTTSDVWDTATSLQLVEASDLLDEEIRNLLDTLKARALEHKDTLMMGRTHGVHAEPITFGLKLALWWDEMRRNRERLAQARNAVAVGKISGPVGTHATVSPKIEEKVCRRLGLEPAPVSNQVLQRDRHAQFVTTMAIIAASLEKFATEIRGLQRTEIREVEEPFPEGQPGSSSMPHKRNPELSERVCGLARLVRGHAVTALENVALWGERDISHSSAERVILPDVCLALDYILDLFAGVVRGLHVYPERMKQNIESTRGVLFSQRVLLALVEKGLAREDAYQIVHRLSMISWQEEKDLRDLLRAAPDVTSHLSISELDALFDYGYYVRYVDYVFHRAGLL
ncbi:MAG: adenylosuccinate lyase [Chloroflexi bacterium]|nr:adenylosuccinate lyase [Chloroflexota bacterium]